jgi:branched-chain amino acid transport system substrate-binding protein
MKRSSSGSRAVSRLLSTGLVVALALGAAACGDSDDSDSGSATTAAPNESAGTSAPAGDPLGEPNAATKPPVKVGFLTDGGDCAECSDTAGNERPVAEATAKWANEYLGGLAGHEIELVTCVTGLDPAKSTDCANQMVTDGVVAVVTGAGGALEPSYKVLHDAGIPFINYSLTQAEMLEDDASTFIMQGSEALTVELPLSVAQDVDAKTVSVIVVNLPIATETYGGDTPARFQDAGIELDLVPVDLGTPDMTPQAQQIVQKNPDGVVMITGHDAFCIPAINGLKDAGFEGTIVTISHCITDAMKDAIPDDIKDGMIIAANAPIGDDADASMQQYQAVLEKYGAGDVDPEEATPLAVFSALSGLSVGTKGLEGEVTPASVIAAYRAMQSESLPGTGSRPFRCNGKAAPETPAVCANSTLKATLDADGNPVTYERINDQPIPD